MARPSSIIIAAAATQLRLMLRDRRLAWAGAILLLVAFASLAAGYARHQTLREERAAAAAQDAEVWAAQGQANPHGAAHFGRNVYPDISPLAAFDPGLMDQLGTSVRLESHAQNPSRDRPSEGGAALSRFAGFSPAWALQVVAPLLIILAGFTAFSGEAARDRLRQEVASGASTTRLVLGRALGLCLAALSVVLLFGVAGSATLLAAGEGGWSALAILASGYGLYLCAFAILTVGVSARLASARLCLTVMLTVWALSTLLAPRVVPALAEQLHPTPTAPAFEEAVSDEAKNGPNGHDPADARLDALKAKTLQRYGVTDIEDLPINWSGVALEFGEENSTKAYRRHYERLRALYAAQADVQRGFALLAPTLAARPLSAAYAQTDWAAHQRFLMAAEAYRYELIQTLNRDIIKNRPPGDAPYMADVDAITRHLRFKAPRPDLAETWRAQRLNLLILALWVLAATGLAMWSGRRLERSL
ncbi:DUF3526 domain-containing protein [Caulobacter sp. NIBR2454]|uniref:DUF3526 domain-containing protein n=1 Tax=Caulobacter sp. NIBR2454 TaxID=3015996 RepID=UPI0022B6333A|nr:DUF3526 domain-containing protein [Caulobacter sp. NIBR2454]